RGGPPGVRGRRVGEGEQHASSVGGATDAVRDRRGPRATGVRPVARGSLNAMAQYTRHPVAPPPAPPARETTGHLMVRAVAVLLLFAVLAHTAVYNLVGPVGSMAVLTALTLGALAIWVPAIARRRPTRFPWRRLPWAALGYGALALVSLIWSRWPGATALTWTLLAAVTVAALYVGTMLTWHEIV